MGWECGNCSCRPSVENGSAEGWTGGVKEERRTIASLVSKSHDELLIHCWFATEECWRVWSLDWLHSPFWFDGAQWGMSFETSFFPSSGSEFCTSDFPHFIFYSSRLWSSFLFTHFQSLLAWPSPTTHEIDSLIKVMMINIRYCYLHSFGLPSGWYIMGVMVADLCLPLDSGHR